ncbi:hypothetical protein H0H92_008795, partial [Tricholoma furcatifolium]
MPPEAKRSPACSATSRRVQDDAQHPPLSTPPQTPPLTAHDRPPTPTTATRAANNPSRPNNHPNACTRHSTTTHAPSEHPERECITVPLVQSKFHMESIRIP